MTTHEILVKAKETAPFAAQLDDVTRGAALTAMADALLKNAEFILSENAADVEAARGRISDVMLDRLKLTQKRLNDMAKGLTDVSKLPDPVGRLIEERTLGNGLDLKKVSVPMGVIAIIYESRPNVTSDAAALCLKSGNVCVLRGGRDAYRSSQAIVKAMREGLSSVSLPETLVNILEDTTHAGANELMTARGLVDLLIPRGGARLIRACVENARVPVIETGTGICSVYVDETADQDMALDIIENAKTQRPSVCNAEETLLVNEKIAAEFLPKLRSRIPQVELRLCPAALRIIDGTPAAENDFDTEFLDYILAVKVVKDVREAVSHIAAHSTHHSESIVTKDMDAAAYFTRNVDSACVYVNASTRFTDGGCFGLGCEMGISTQKLHARGPMGLSELTSYKYIITGNGQVRK